MNLPVPAPIASSRRSRMSLAVFAAGDFAFNLYWQSIMLFLLFYYTDTLGLSVLAASTTYLVASFWDGLAGLLVGLIVDRHGSERIYRSCLMIGGPILGTSFVLTFLPPPTPGMNGIVFVFASHLLFRTAYAAVNVPYLAMSARVSVDGGDRAFVAGARMLAGTAAAVVVALGTGRLGTLLVGSAGQNYLLAAIVFGLLGGLILFVVGTRYRDGSRLPRSSPLPFPAAAAALARNRAFVTLVGAMMAMIVAVTVLNKSVLYFFKYAMHDEEAGQLALAAMMAVSGAAVPLWMFLGRRTGTRRLWMLASALCISLLLLFAALDVTRAGTMQLFLAVLQTGTVGLNFALWAMLPEAVDYGPERGGVRVEAALFGLTALLQRVAIGLATGLLGLSFVRAGYQANQVQSAATLSDMRAAIVMLPLSFFALSAVLIALCPLGGRQLERPRHPFRLRRGRNPQVEGSRLYD